MAQPDCIGELEGKSTNELREMLARERQERIRERADRLRLKEQLDAGSRLKSAVRLASGRARRVKSVDVCFVFDCTKSMKPHLTAAKQRMAQIQNFILTYMGEEACVRFAVVGFRDYGSEEPLTVFPFTESAEEVAQRLGSLQLLSGQDVAEDVLSGLQAAVDLQWWAPTRVVYLICDSPGHGRRFHDYGPREDFYLDETRQWAETDAMFEKMRFLGLNFVGLQLTPMCAKMFSVFQKLHSQDGIGLTSMVMTLSNSSAVDFASCVIRGCSSSISSSLTMLGRAPQGCLRPPPSELDFELRDLDWEDSESWPQHSVLLTSYILPNLHSQPRPTRMIRTIRVRQQPFGQGAMRFAFPAVTGGAEEMKLVVKVPKHLSEDVSPEESVRADALMQSTAQYFALQFSRRHPSMPLQFVHANAMRITDRPDFEFCTAEPFIPGQYEKYTNNAGYVSADSDIAQAFSHFTWHFSGGDIMVTDIQGVSGSVLTDPQIHSADKSKFGRGNLGVEGMDWFFMFHRCNAICRRLKLKPSPLQIPGAEVDAACGLSPTAASSASATTAVAEPDVASAAPEPRAPPRPLLCQGQCGTPVAAAGEDYLQCMETYGGIFCKDCQVKIRTSSCTEPCASPDCPGFVTYSLFALGIWGVDPPQLCRDCEADEGDWTLLGLE